jgi:alkylation response protein AidB-like acyl-CoA dehydrogenase
LRGKGSEVDFGLTEEQRLIRETVREFMAGECPREQARELDERGIFPEELLQKLAELGFCALTVPEEFDGAGPNLLGAAIVVEEVARICPTLASAFACTTFRGGQVLSHLGSSAQKESLLPQLAAGTLLLSYALSEPSSSTPCEEAGTFAVVEGDVFVLTGTKSFVKLAERADHLLTLARTGGAAEDKTSLSIFLVPARDPAVQSQAIESLGYRGARPSNVAFEGARLAGDRVLGGFDQLHQGAEQVPVLMALDQLAVGAEGVGLAQGAYAYAEEYAGDRVQFGRPIGEFEAIQHKFVEMAIAIRSTRLLLYEACWRADVGASFRLEAAMAAVRATSLARRVALEAVHILGGQGYMLETDAQRYVRDSLVLFSGGEGDGWLKSSAGALLGVGRAPESEFAIAERGTLEEG